MKLFRQVVQGRSISSIAIRTEREQRFRRDPNSFIRILSSTGLGVARYSVNPDRQHLDESIVWNKIARQYVPTNLTATVTVVDIGFMPSTEQDRMLDGKIYERILDLQNSLAEALGMSPPNCNNILIDSRKVGIRFLRHRYAGVLRATMGTTGPIRNVIHPNRLRYRIAKRLTSLAALITTANMGLR